MRQPHPILTLLAAFALTVACSAFRAHSQSASKQSGKPAPKPATEEKELRFKADKVSTQKIGGHDVLILTGHAQLEVPEDELTLAADRVEVDQETKVAKATGNVKVLRGEDVDIVADALTANFDENQTVFTGSVRCIFKSKPKPTSSNQQPQANVSKPSDKPEVKTTTLTCERLEYDLDNKKATATGKLHVTYEGGSATAEKALFLEEDKLVTLEGKVSITHEGENKVALTLDKATVNVETGELDGDNPKGSIMLKRKEKK